MSSQGAERTTQAWVIAAIGLVVVGLIWIVVSVTASTPTFPVFGVLLFGAGVVCGLVGMFLGGRR